ncbi:MAG: cytochrome-c oxidase [Pseudomonas sp.]|uniref:cytochrome c oxidase subunit 3 n=1 Tax=Pseudomonas sp. FEMGT703P TaxID=2080764 RepID=UPI000CAF73A1|nr:cytochrome c oxidase subunit 3 [Pseudomonas sp. FEMGT703P]PJE40613.1 MAG: cytochrome-c oxidase [Pseudomonas sp.] [Pseudomonas sp. FEMGT703P]
MSTSLELTLRPDASPTRHLPGDLAMWFFILAELTVFALLLLTFAVAQALQPQLFHDGRQLLDSSTGLALTLSLLTSGLFAALAQEQVRQAQARRGAWLLLAALLSASVYVWLKLGEYSHLANSGLGMEHNTFFILYWILTGFHFVHVLLGLVILSWLAERCRQGAYGPGNCSALESGVLYWHMVDLVWVLLFPLVYVLN